MGIPIDSTYNPGHARPSKRIEVRPKILLRSGTYFDLIHPIRNEFTLTEIAWGLARTCRFNGQLKDDLYYSVAEHSLWVSFRLPPELAWQGLMHDAAEAILGDMTRPLKQLLPDYRLIEKRIERALFDRLGIDTIAPLVKHMDLVALATEARDLMNRLPNDLPWEIEAMGIKPSNHRISNQLTYREAAEHFLSYAQMLRQRGLVPQCAESLFEGVPA